VPAALNRDRMNIAPASLRSTAAAFARGWQSFFHQPCDARVCAAIRIGYAAIVLMHLAVLYPDLDLWFTDNGVLPLEGALKIASPYSWSLLELWPSTSAVVHTCFWIAIAHSVCLLIGLLPRLNALALFVWIVSFQVRNDVINDGEDCLMRLMGFFMIWLPSGRCWSVNALVRSWWNRAKEQEAGDRQQKYAAVGWPLRLLQIEMAAMFMSAALMKLAGADWLNGTALYYVSRLDDFFGRFPFPAWPFDSPRAVALMTWSVIAVEFFVPILIWFRETRRPCLLLLVAFHLANEWTMNLFLFHWLMLCGWISFVSPDDIALLFGRRRLRSPRDRRSSDSLEATSPLAKTTAA